MAASAVHNSVGPHSLSLKPSFPAEKDKKRNRLPFSNTGTSPTGANSREKLLRGFSNTGTSPTRARANSHKNLFTGGEIRSSSSLLNKTSSKATFDSGSFDHGFIFGEEKMSKLNVDDDNFLEWYRKVAGMHTVGDWMKNYEKHPYAWGALIMLHGVPEVSSRLRSKVENFAVYSAVLLSASIVLMCLTDLNVDNNFSRSDIWLRRVYIYSLCISVSSHMLSVLLSMSFVNALNEAGRDSDVIRMFGEGRGYHATVKCEKAFKIGILFLAIAALATVAMNFSYYDAVACGAIGSVIIYQVRGTTKMLLDSSSMASYWRWGRGQDNDDAYDLTLPLERVKEKAKASELLNRFIIKYGEERIKDGKEEDERERDREEGIRNESEADVGVDVRVNVNVKDDETSVSSKVHPTKDDEDYEREEKEGGESDSKSFEGDVDVDFNVNVKDDETSVSSKVHPTKDEDDEREEKEGGETDSILPSNDFESDSILPSNDFESDSILPSNDFESVVVGI